MSIAQVYALKLPSGRQGHACIANLQSFPVMGLDENLPNPSSRALTLHSERPLNLSCGWGLGGFIHLLLQVFHQQRIPSDFQPFLTKHDVAVAGNRKGNVPLTSYASASPLQNRSWKCCQGPAEAFTSYRYQCSGVLSMAGPGMQIFK